MRKKLREKERATEQNVPKKKAEREIEVKSYWVYTYALWRRQ